MFLNLHPKCANPSCAAAFDWTAGGKLFRFHRDPWEFARANGDGSLFINSHRVEHFWLCERCSRVYMLGYEPGRGVLIRAMRPVLTAAENRMRLPAH